MYLLSFPKEHFRARRHRFRTAKEASAARVTVADLRWIAAHPVPLRICTDQHLLEGIAVLGRWRGMTSIGRGPYPALDRHVGLDPSLLNLFQPHHQGGGDMIIPVAAVAGVPATAATVIAVAAIGAGA